MKGGSWATQEEKSLRLLDYKLLFCPSSNVSYQEGLRMIRSPHYQVYSDYGYNWYILSNTLKCKLEKISHCKIPSQQFVTMDCCKKLGVPSSFSNGTSLVNSYSSTTERFPDAFKHNGKINALYADGHTGSVRI